MVLELPPAPAALVLLGRWLETFSARSAAAFLRMTVAGPPGGLGDAGRAVVEPDAALLTGEVGRGADCREHVSYCRWRLQAAHMRHVNVRLFEVRAPSDRAKDSCSSATNSRPVSQYSSCMA